MSDTGDLDVPIYRQNPLRAECVPVCLKMVIDYLNAHKLREQVGNLEVADIAGIVKTDNVGTEIEDVNLLNEDPAIRGAAPSVEFNASQKPRDLKDIISDRRNAIPCIAWIAVGTPPFQWKHAVVVVNIGRGTNFIRYNEPMKGVRIEEKLDAFTQEWGASDNWLVRLILGRRENRDLVEYVRRPVNKK